MVSPTELNLPGIEDDFPDDMTPRPLDEHFESSNMPPPPMIQIAPLTLNSIWDSDMMTKYTDDVTGQKKWRCGHCGKEWFEHNATKALGHVVDIVKDIKACSGMIPPHYKEAYLNFYHSKYDTKAFQRQSVAKLNTSLDTTDQKTIASLAKRGPECTASLGQVDVMDTSPITNSVTAALLSFASNKKQKGTVQTLLSNQFHAAAGISSHPDAVRAANVAFALF